MYISNEDYGERGTAVPEEKKALRRVYEEALEKQFSTGTVHVYVLDASGQVIDTRHVAKACEKGEVARLLESVVARFKIPTGQPVVKPRPQSRPGQASAESLVLHLTARGRGCSWDELPAESWIVLEPSQWAQLLPPRGIAAGKTWDVERSVAERILTHFYPQTENNDATPRRIEQVTLTARPLEAATLPTPGGLASGARRIRLDGSVRLRHTFYPGRADDRVVEASVVGHVDFEPLANGGGKIQTLRLVTTRATYGPGTLDVAVREAQP